MLSIRSVATIVSVTVQKADVYLHRDLEFWTNSHSKRRLHRKFWTF